MNNYAQPRTSRRFILENSIARILATALTCAAAHAASLDWDTAPGTVGAGDSAITGGGGTWDLANGNWTVDAGVNNIAWVNNVVPDSAVFGGAGGAITLGAAITAEALTFNSAGYSIGGGTLTLAGAVPAIVTNADASIDAILAGTGGFTKLGAGQLTLDGAGSNTLTGTTILDNGTLVLGKTGGAFAILGAVQMGAGVGPNQPNLRMAANEQFGAGVVMTFVNPFGSFPRFDLQGTTQTLAGIVDATGAGVIQNERLGGGGTSGPATLTLDVAGSHSFNGYMRDRDNGPGVFLLNLVKNGVGTQTLTGGNVTYTGTTTVNGGTLELLNNTAFASAVTVESGGTYRITNSAASNPYTELGGTAAIVVNAGGVLELNNATTDYANRKTLSGSVSGAGTINVIGTGALALNSVNNITLSGQINILSGGLGNDGGASANAFGTTTAGLDISSGAYFDLRGGAPQFGGLSGAGEVINSFVANTITLGAADGSGTFTGTMKNGGNAFTGTASFDGSALSLTKIGSGTQVLGVTNAAGSDITYTGATTVNAGTLVLKDAKLVGGAKTVAAGAVLEINSTIPFDIPPGSRWNNSGTISGAGIINKTGSGVFGTDGVVNFSGTINILDGRLHNDNVAGNWTGSTADVNISATGVLDLRANDMYVDELNGSGEVWNSHPAGGGDALYVGVADGSSSYAGNILGNGSQAADNPNGAVLSLVKRGTGTFTASGTNTYSGTTSVENGTLLITGSLSGSIVEVQSGGTFGGTGTIGGSVVVHAGGKLSPGTSPGTLTITGTELDVSGAVSGTNSQALVFELGTVSDRVDLNFPGQFNLGSGVMEFDDFAFTAGIGFGPGTYTLLNSTQDVFGTLGANLTGTIGAFTATLSLADTNNDVLLTVVPEPGSAALLLAGLACFGLRRRRA